MLARLVALSLVLSACSSDGGVGIRGDSPFFLAFQQIKTLAKAKLGKGAAADDAAAGMAGGGAAAASLQKALAKAEGPILVGIIEAGQIPAVLQPKADNNGYLTWIGPDGRGMTFYAGVLSSTRGYGGDLLAYDATGTAAAMKGASGSYQRALRFLGTQYQLKASTLTCSMEFKGSETIKVVDTERQTRHYVETCSDQGGGTLNNDYWLGGDGTMWQSRQWAGPYLGHITFQRVKA